MTDPSSADRACMARLQKGDDHALNELMDRWQKPLASFLLRMTGNESIAIDLAQETFVRVYESRRSFRGGAFNAWLFSIAANLCKNHARWQSRHPTVSLDAMNGENPIRETPSPAASPSEQALSTELADAVRDAIQSLPEDLKIAIILFEYQDLSHSEIAAALGCTSKAVETRLYRARQILREKLARWI